MWYTLNVNWQMVGAFEVEAESLEAAVTKAYDASLPDGEYLDDSFDVVAVVDDGFNETPIDQALVTDALARKECKKQELASNEAGNQPIKCCKCGKAVVDADDFSYCPYCGNIACCECEVVNDDGETVCDGCRKPKERDDDA